MDEQMEMAFGEAERVDPVSGNDVPPGSLPEEVRDDIPAMLSEGEYVVPADVLRFYGVKFFEDLRKEAKMGLADMEANGRIGGEPVMDEELPFSDEELMSMDMPDTEEVAAAKGGLMGFQEGGLNYPAYIKQPDLSFLGGEQGGMGLEYRVYVNEAGMTITIPFFDGEPMGMIPPGYTPQGATPAATDADSMGGVTDTGDDVSAASVSQGKGSEDRTPINEMNANQVAETFGNTVNFDTTLGKIGLSAVGIFGGGITNLIAKGLSNVSGNERKELQERADIIGLDLASVDDPYNLTRDNFTSDDAFSNAMQSVAPEGMTYDPNVTTTIKSDDGSTTDITGGYTREGSSAPTTSIRPQGRPDNLGSNSSDTGGGFISGGGSDNIGEYGAVGDFFGGIGDALGITNYSGQNDEDEDK